MLKAWNLSIFRRTIRKYGRLEYYRAFLLTWLASLQIYLKTKKRLHIKTIIQLPLDCIVTPTWPPFHGTPLWPPWRPCGNILYSSEDCMCFPITHSRLSIVTHPLVASARPLWLSSHLPCSGSLKHEERTIEKLTLCYTTLG